MITVTKLIRYFSRRLFRRLWRSIDWPARRLYRYCYLVCGLRSWSARCLRQNVDSHSVLSSSYSKHHSKSSTKPSVNDIYFYCVPLFSRLYRIRYVNLLRAVIQNWARRGPRPLCCCCPNEIWSVCWRTMDDSMHDSIVCTLNNGSSKRCHQDNDENYNW